MRAGGGRGAGAIADRGTRSYHRELLARWDVALLPGTVVVGNAFSGYVRRGRESERGQVNAADTVAVQALRPRHWPPLVRRVEGWVVEQPLPPDPPDSGPRDGGGAARGGVSRMSGRSGVQRHQRAQVRARLGEESGR